MVNDVAETNKKRPLTWNAKVILSYYIPFILSK